MVVVPKKYEEYPVQMSNPLEMRENLKKYSENAENWLKRDLIGAIRKTNDVR